jgi:hypothetical protein
VKLACTLTATSTHIWAFPFDMIAEALNGKKAVLVPPGAESWTAEIVRKAYVS